MTSISKKNYFNQISKIEFFNEINHQEIEKIKFNFLSSFLGNSEFENNLWLSLSVPISQDFIIAERCWQMCVGNKTTNTISPSIKRTLQDR